LTAEAASSANVTVKSGSGCFERESTFMMRNIRRFYAGSLGNNLSYDSGFVYDSARDELQIDVEISGLIFAKCCVAKNFVRQRLTGFHRSWREPRARSAGDLAFSVIHGSCPVTQGCHKTAKMPVVIRRWISSWFWVFVVHGSWRVTIGRHKTTANGEPRSGQTTDSLFCYLNSRFAKLGSIKEKPRQRCNAVGPEFMFADVTVYDDGLVARSGVQSTLSFDVPRSGATYSFDLNRLKTCSISCRSYPRLIKSPNAAETIPTDAGSNEDCLGQVATAASNAKPTTSDSGRRARSRLQRQAAVLRRPDARWRGFLSSGVIGRSFELGRLSARARRVLRTWSMDSGDWGYGSRRVMAGRIQHKLARRKVAKR
jgi:hypothetical protein